MPVITRLGTQKLTTMSDYDNNGASNSPEQVADPEQNTGDPLWDKMMKLPFFRQADVEKQQQLYEREKEREMEEERRREEREEERRREEREIEAERRREEREEERRREEREREAERRREDREHELEVLRLQNEREIRVSQASRDSNPVESSAPRRAQVNIPAWTQTTRPDKFFSTSEKLFAAANIPPELWVGYLIEKLSERARNVYSALPTEEANQYDKLKAAILADYQVAPSIYRRNFFSWSRKSNQTYAEFMKELDEQLSLWSSAHGDTTIDWRDLLLRYRFESQLSEELNLYILDKKVNSLPGVHSTRR